MSWQNNAKLEDRLAASLEAEELAGDNQYEIPQFTSHISDALFPGTCVRAVRACKTPSAIRSSASFLQCCISHYFGSFTI